MSAQEATTERKSSIKRKGPPTFHHLPTSRAKKLKKEWVEIKKIKRAYRTQKRKMSMGTGSNIGVADSGWTQRGSIVLDESERVIGRDEKPGSAEEEHDESGNMVLETVGTTQSSPTLDLSIPKRSKASSGSSQGRYDAGNHKVESADARNVKPSPRDLKREAYSRSSLHVHKSNPVQRRRINHKISRPSSEDPKQTHSKRGGGSQERKGQPNMALRMASMLEEIKRRI